MEQIKWTCKKHNEGNPLVAEEIYKLQEELQSKMIAYAHSRIEYAIYWAMYYLPADAILILETLPNGITRAATVSDLRKDAFILDIDFEVLPSWMPEVKEFVEKHLIDKISELTYQLKPVKWEF